MASEESDWELLAEWEQRLRLVRQLVPDGTQQFVIDELGEAGDVLCSSSYAHDDFPVAAGEYGSRIADALDSSPGSAARVLNETLQALARADVEALEELFHNDYMHLDHRPLGYPDVDKAGMIEWQVIQSDMPAVWLAQSIDAWNWAGGVSTGGYWGARFGRWTPYEFGIHLAVVENGQVLQAEIFPEGELDAALARFAELTSSLEADV